MTDAIVETRSLAAPVAGLTAGFVAALALVYTGDFLFLTAPQWKGALSLNPKTHTAAFVANYGVWLWIGISAGTGAALFLAFRHPHRISTTAVNFLACGLSSCLAYLVHLAAWQPLINTRF